MGEERDRREGKGKGNDLKGNRENRYDLWILNWFRFWFWSVVVVGVGFGLRLGLWCKGMGMGSGGGDGGEGHCLFNDFGIFCVFLGKEGGRMVKDKSDMNTSAAIRDMTDSVLVLASGVDLSTGAFVHSSFQL